MFQQRRTKSNKKRKKIIPFRDNKKHYPYLNDTNSTIIGHGRAKTFTLTL